MDLYFCHATLSQGLLLVQNGGRRNPGQGCWNTPRIVKYFVKWHIMKWLFRRLFPAYGDPVCFLQSETVKRRHFVVFTWRSSNGFLEPLQGFSDPPFWTRRRPWGRGCLMRSIVLLSSWVLRLNCGIDHNAFIVVFYFVWRTFESSFKRSLFVVFEIL